MDYIIYTKRKSNSYVIFDIYNKRYYKKYNINDDSYVFTDNKNEAYFFSLQRIAIELKNMLNVLFDNCFVVMEV